MADYSTTVSNVVRAFGSRPTEMWGAMVWGTDNWAFGTEDLPVAVIKILDNSQSSDTDQTVSKQAFSQIDETVSFNSETYSEYLSDGSGYFYVFTGNVTNADNRATASWSQLSYDTATYTTATRPTTTWT